ncbi:uncharacterized protein LOC135088980 isoform X1 [Scylla paramamosain]|uniref:uncharacterized protein LOC135088980 isoform X1 n=1 Tax=Scylla paramamosain TaxID=85552 RepID=UPI0030836A4E
MLRRHKMKWQPWILKRELSVLETQRVWECSWSSSAQCQFSSWLPCTASTLCSCLLCPTAACRGAPGRCWSKSARPSKPRSCSGRSRKGELAASTLSHAFLQTDSTKHAVAGSIVLTGVWVGAALIIAELIKGIGTKIYPLEGSQGDEKIPFSVRSASASTSLLKRALAGIDSVNARMASEERAVCRKMSLCQMGSMTSGLKFVHTFLQILRPAFPQIDQSWDGLLAGEAQEDCNLLYPECPSAILRAMFGDVY